MRKSRRSGTASVCRRRLLSSADRVMGLVVGGVRLGVDAEVRWGGVLGRWGWGWLIVGVVRGGGVVGGDLVVVLVDLGQGIRGRRRHRDGVRRGL